MSDFFTAVSFGKHCTSKMDKFIEGVDDYFYLGVKKKQCVISGQENEKNKATILLDKKTTLAALKIISYLTGVIPLIMLGLKAILRCTHHYHIIDPKQKLEEGVNISNETIQKVQATATKILDLPQDEIDDLNAETELPDDPNNTEFINDTSSINEDLTAAFFFKKSIGASTDTTARTETIQMYPDRGEKEPSQAEEQFNHMIKSKEACLYHNFDHLIIPQAKLIEAGNRKFVAREGMEVFEQAMAMSNDHVRISLMKESVRQLTRFIIEARFTGKIFVQDSSEDSGLRKFILLDPKPFSCSVEEALFGGHDDINAVHTSPPLIDAFSSETLIDTILDEAYTQGIMDPDRRERIKVNRMDQIRENPPEAHPIYETLTI